jgi:tetratricopeptide (TPR) repeat protein
MKVEEYCEHGQLFVIKQHYLEAIQMYQAALDINPHHEPSRMKLAATEATLHSLIDSMTETGKRYWERRQYRQARAMFQRILEFDSTEQSAQKALATIDSERRVVVDSLLNAGDTAMRQSLLETARNAYEKAIAIDPGNTIAGRRLSSLKEQLTIRVLLEEGQKQLTLGNVQDALGAFRLVLEKDPSNGEAKKNVTLCLAALRNTVADLYQEGLHAYSNEEYETAIDLFTRVLTIEPGHKTAPEYLQRANEKLRALEQLP